MGRRSSTPRSGWLVELWRGSRLSVRFIRLSASSFGEAHLIWAAPGSTYPLDLVRSRLSIATASIPVASQSKLTAQSSAARALSSAYHTASSSIPLRPSPSDLTVWGMTLKVVREEGGIRALYRGIVTTSMGVAPYVGINFASYEALRAVLTPPGKTGVLRKLTCGALAGKFQLPGDSSGSWQHLTSYPRFDLANSDVSFRRAPPQDAGGGHEGWSLGDEVRQRLGCSLKYYSYRRVSRIIPGPLAKST
jgi:hypothetical protein